MNSKIGSLGTVHVVSRNDIIEIRIDYESDRDPNGTFLAPFPSGHPVTHILAIALDIHYNTRNVLAKPVLFMRQEQPYNKKDRFPPSAQIYKKSASAVSAIHQVRGLADGTKHTEDFAGRKNCRNIRRA
jgi:hypothetical protein